MKRYLTETARSKILKRLTKEQKKTLFSVVGKRYRSYFAEVLAKYKGSKEWSFYRMIDHDSVQKDVTCECGKPLRYQYILINKKTKQKRTIGSTHLIEELNIPESIAAEVLKGAHSINYDLDELLLKYKEGWELPEYIKRNIEKIKVPGEIKKLLTMKLPLLFRHLDLLYTKLSKLNTKNKKRNIYTLDLMGGSVQYEIKNETIFQVLIGEIDSFTYIDTFRDDIDLYFKKQKKYTPVYDLINYLIGVGLPNELLYGQHALNKHFIRYLSHRPELKLKVKEDGYMNCKRL